MRRQIAWAALLFGFLGPGAVVSAEEIAYQRVAKAEPDECYNGFGQPYVPIDECDGTGIPKRNQSYVWGMTRWGHRLWIGTAANIAHLARGVVGFAFPIETPDFVIEAWDSQYPGVPEAVVNTYRSIAIFRGRDFGEFWRPPKIELLYGESRLPRYTSAHGGGWQLADNGMGGAAPLYGPSGFGSLENMYTWTMAVYRGALFVGLNEIPFSSGGTRGSDLWRFPDSRSPAVLVDNAGLTTPLNEGIRAMVVAPDALYLGMTNGANLSPEGGWEVIRLISTGDP